MITTTGRPALLAAAALLLALPAGATARDALALEAAEAMKELKPKLKKVGADAVAVGEFVCTSPEQQKFATGGPGLAAALRLELLRANVKVEANAKVVLSGTFQDVTDKDTKLLCVHIAIHVRDRSNKDLCEPVERAAFGAAMVAQLFGVPIPPPKPNPTPRDISEGLVVSLDRPSVHIDGDKVRSGRDSKFAMQLVVDETPRAPTEKDGRAYARIKREEEYAVKLINDADYEIAVKVTIDGLSIFNFAEERDENGDPKYSRIVVPPNSSMTISGWFITKGQSEKFKVTEYANSAAASETAKQLKGIGTVSAHVVASWPKGGTPPDDEKGEAAAYAKDGDATGRGASFDEKFNVFERKFGGTRDAVSIRYNRDPK